MAKKRTRRKFSDDDKMKSVARVLGGSSVHAEAQRIKASGTVVRRWVDDKRYQPDAKPSSSHGGARSGAGRKKASGADPLQDAPAVAAATSAKRPKAKPLVPSGFMCPHCNGPITLED